MSMASRAFRPVVVIPVYNHEEAIGAMVAGVRRHGIDCLLVDDLIDTAGTLVKASEALLEEGARSVPACATQAPEPGGWISPNAWTMVPAVSVSAVALYSVLLSAIVARPVPPYPTAIVSPCHSPPVITSRSEIVIPESCTAPVPFQRTSRAR